LRKIIDKNSTENHTQPRENINIFFATKKISLVLRNGAANILPYHVENIMFNEISTGISHLWNTSYAVRWI